MHNEGKTCFILPNTLLDNYFEDLIRKKILDNSLYELNDLSDRVFENAVVHSMIIRYGKGPNSINNVVVNTSDSLCGDQSLIPTSFFSSQPNYTFDLRSYGNDEILSKLKIDSVKLEDILDIRQAIKTGDDKTYISDLPLDSTYKPILRGKDVQRFYFTSPNLFVQYGRHLACPRSKDIFEQPKILIREAGAKITAAIDVENYYVMSSLYNAILKTQDYSIEYLLGLINSQLFQFIMDKLTFEKTKGAFTKAKIYHYYNLPVKRANQGLQSEIGNLVKQITILAKKGFDYSKEEYLLNRKVFELYNLSEEEISEIVAHCS